MLEVDLNQTQFLLCSKLSYLSLWYVSNRNPALHSLTMRYFLAYSLHFLDTHEPLVGHRHSKTLGLVTPRVA